MGVSHKVNSDKTLADLLLHCKELYERYRYYIVKFENLGGTRTLTQNAAMHKYFELLAKALNDAGYDMKKVLRPEADIPWMTETVKQNIWVPMQSNLGLGEKTSKLGWDEVSAVYDPLNRHFSEKFGVHVPFPKKEAA